MFKLFFVQGIKQNYLYYEFFVLLNTMFYIIEYLLTWCINGFVRITQMYTVKNSVKKRKIFFPL